MKNVTNWMIVANTAYQIDAGWFKPRRNVQVCAIWLQKNFVRVIEIYHNRKVKKIFEEIGVTDEELPFS